MLSGWINQPEGQVGAVDWFSLIVLGVIIGSNNLAVALALGSMGQVVRIWKVVFVFGAFEFFVPLVGLWLGLMVSRLIVQHAGWVSVLLIAGVGAWMIWAGFTGGSFGEQLVSKVTTWFGLMLLALGLSIDNLIIGFSLGLKEVEPLLLAGTISIFSMVFTWLGIHIGNISRRNWERSSEIVAGALLLLLALARCRDWI